MSTKRKRTPAVAPVAGRQGETRLADGAVVTFHRRDVFTSSEASAFFRDIRANTTWGRETLTVYGQQARTCPGRCQAHLQRRGSRAASRGGFAGQLTRRARNPHHKLRAAARADATPPRASVARVAPPPRSTW
jgi:hypothetical protein